MAMQHASLGRVSYIVHLFVSKLIELSYSFIPTGNSDSESQWQGGDSDQQTFSPSEFLGQPGGGGNMFYIDRCIIIKIQRERHSN